jgi:hypothetical protein
MADVYPLQWPQGWARSTVQRASKFRTSNTAARKLLVAELDRLKASGVVISTNVPLKADGTMRMDREPVDSGVAVYFQRDGKQVVFACDQYDIMADNLQAIAKTIEAMRGIERWGAGEMMDRAFSGFKGLPAKASDGEDCWKVLELPPMSPAHLVKLVHRDLTRKLHSKEAGYEEFSRINVARDDALRALAARS